MAVLEALQGSGRRGRTYDPERLSSPQVFLASMVIFLAIAAFVTAILYRQLSKAFSANPGLNALIGGVLLIGILLAIYQVFRLFRKSPGSMPFVPEWLTTI